MLQIRYIYALVMLVMLFSVTVTATDSFYQCLNSTTLQYNQTIFKTNGTINETTTTSQNTQCRFGCDTGLNACKDDNTTTGYETPLLGAVFLAGLFFYLAIELDASRKGLQFLFIMLGFFTMYFTVRVWGEIAERKFQNTIVTLLNGAEWAIGAVILVILMYFAIDYVRGILEELGKV